MLWNPHVSRGVYVMCGLWYVLWLSYPLFLSLSLAFSFIFAFNKLHWLTWQQATNSRWLHVLAASPLNVFTVVVAVVVVAACDANDAWRWAAICMHHHCCLNIAFIVCCQVAAATNEAEPEADPGTGKVASEHGSKPLANVASVAIVQTSSVLCCCHSQRLSDF